jgi:hypothetical protein
MPTGKPLTASEMALLNEPACTAVTGIVAAAFCITLTALLVVTLKFGGTTSVIGSVMVWLYVPPLAVIPNVNVPALAVVAVIIASVLLPVPGISVELDSEVVTPVGRVPTARATLAGKFPFGEVQVTLTFVAFPTVIDRAVAETVSEQLCGIAVTVRVIVAVFVKLPPLAVTVTV